MTRSERKTLMQERLFLTICVNVTSRYTALHTLMYNYKSYCLMYVVIVNPFEYI